MTGITPHPTGHNPTSLSGQGSIQYGSPDPKAMAGVTAEPIFSASDLEQLCFRRYNPFARLNAQNLSLALDQFDSGVLMPAALFWQQIATRDHTTITVKSKREDAVALCELTHSQLEETPEAADQAAALGLFYRALRAGHALNRHVTGGAPLLLAQMMESVAYLYAVHHIVWKPDAATLWKLPSGKTVPALTALFEQVPLQFFEARTGELRFLGLSLGFTGEPLAPNNWLTTTGPGLMRAASSLFYFKRLAQHDMINFSEKFGTPGIEVETTGAKDSAEGTAARDLARQLAANWRGVRYGSDKNAVNFLWPTGGVSGTALPMHTITEDAKRDMAILWLGEDLSTMSRGGNEKAVGSNAQEDEREKRERADCARISETLQSTIDPIVLRWFFGEDTPILAKTEIKMPVNEDRSLLGTLVQQAVDLGAEVPIAPVLQRLAIPQAKEGEEIFQKAASPTGEDGIPAGNKNPMDDDEKETGINAARLAELLAMPDSEFEIALRAMAVNGGDVSGEPRNEDGEWAESDYQPSPDPMTPRDAAKKLSEGFEHPGHDGRSYKFGKKLLEKFNAKGDRNKRLAHLPHAMATLTKPYNHEEQETQHMHIGLFKHEGGKAIHTFVFTDKNDEVSDVTGYYLPKKGQVKRELKRARGK